MGSFGLEGRFGLGRFGLSRFGTGSFRPILVSRFGLILFNPYMLVHPIIGVLSVFGTAKTQSLII